MRLSTFMVCGLLAVAGPRLASGQASDPNTPSSSRLRALIWLPPETDEVLDRVRGQTNDLGVDLLVDERDPLPDDPHAQLQDAHTLSERHQVTLVIWFAKQSDAEHHFVVNVAIPSKHRLLTRDLGPSLDSAGVGVSSAVKEGAALVVRATIQAVLNGSTIGEAHTAPRELPNESPSSSATPTARSATTDEARLKASTQLPRATAQALEAPESRARARGDWPWSIGLDMFVPYDGVGHNGFATCGAFRVERRSRPLVAFFTGSACVARSLHVADGTVSVGRQQAVIGAHVILWDKDLQLGVGLQAGAVFYERRTLDFPLGTGRASSLHTLGVAGPQFRLLIPHEGSRLSAAVTAGVDLLTNSVIFGYRGPPGLPIDRANLVQAYAALGLAYRF